MSFPYCHLPKICYFFSLLASQYFISLFDMLTWVTLFSLYFILGYRLGWNVCKNNLTHIKILVKIQKKHNCFIIYCCICACTAVRGPWQSDEELQYMFFLFERWKFLSYGGCYGRDGMVFGLTTTYAISAYHHLSCEFYSRSWRDALDTTLCDKVCQWLGAGQWFSPGIPVSSNKTDHHNITEMLLKWH